MKVAPIFNGRHTIIMYETMKKFILLGITSLLAACSGRQSVTVTVSNPIGIDRTEEMIEISADYVFTTLNLGEMSEIVIYDNKAAEIPYQLTHDNKIVFPVSVDSCGTSTYTIQEGVPSIINTVVSGKQYPERLDDIAWENDKSGYRLYGPALFNTGNELYGYDIFTKNISELVLEERYGRELDPNIRLQLKELNDAGKKDEADSLYNWMSYHINHGDGMDAYDVGPTLGAGAAALMTDSVNMVYPKSYDTFEILDNGPLRFSMKLTYLPRVVNEDSCVVETRYIQLDRGSYLNKTTVKFDGLTKSTPLAAGSVIHSQNSEGYEYSADEGYIAYCDSTNNPSAGHGVIYVGLVFPKRLSYVKPVMFDKPAGSALGHVLGVSEYNPEESFVYYWGSGWSFAGLPELSDWTREMVIKAAQVRAPLIVDIK